MSDELPFEIPEVGIVFESTPVKAPSKLRAKWSTAPTQPRAFRFTCLRVRRAYVYMPDPSK